MSLSGKTEGRMRLGIFGGTFDPPHIGHLILAAEAFTQLELDRVLWVLTPFPPHKEDQVITPLKDRLEMLHAMLAVDPAFVLSRVDIDRDPPHFAVGTVKQVREQHPQTDLVYLMGSDSLADLPTWYEAQSFLSACDYIGVMCRPGRMVELDSLDSQLPGLREKVRYIQAPLLEISSSQLRWRMSQGLPFRYYLRPEVYEIIQDRNLYGLGNGVVET